MEFYSERPTMTHAYWNLLAIRKEVIYVPLIKPM